MKPLPSFVLARAARRLWLAAALASSAIGCTAQVEQAEKTAELGDEVVYGADNRQDVLDHSDDSLRQLALRSTAALMFQADVDDSDEDSIQFPNADTLGSFANLCTNKGQRFLDHPSAAQCSATLIDHDLVLTAGHCIDSPGVPTCAQARFVFNYRMDQFGDLDIITADDVFECDEVIVDDDGPAPDYAIIRLDRSAVPRFAPAPIRTNLIALTSGSRLAVMGSPVGIPTKIDSGGVVRIPDNGDFAFEANLDTFGGNSGSGVYEIGSYQLAGILSSGNEDFAAGPADGIPNGCDVVNVCPSEGGGSCEDDTHEVVTYVGAALNDYCSVEPGNERLCEPRYRFDFTATNTTNATQNTTTRYVYLEPGSSISYGTCTEPGSAGFGDTYLRLISPSGASVSFNDDGVGCGNLSRGSYVVPVLRGGLYQLRAGCFGNGACSGTVAYTVTGPADAGAFSYDAVNTASATVNTRDVPVTLAAGDVLTVGTCSRSLTTPTSLERPSYTGNTFLRLLLGNVLQSSNDNACGGQGSQLTFTAAAAGVYTIRAGCSGNLACSGTVAYTINRRSFTYTGVNTNSAQAATTNLNVSLNVGDQITVGTCGMPASAVEDDTYLRLFRGVVEVSSSDDNPDCLNAGSLLTYRAVIAGVHQVRAGCFGNTSCSGTVTVQVIRAPLITTGSASFAYNTTNTNNATLNTDNFGLYLRAGQRIQVSTCPSVPGASGVGDTYLRLFAPESVQSTSSNNSCAAVGGAALSTFTYIVPAGRAGSFQIRGGCAANGACNGVIVARNQ